VLERLSIIIPVYNGRSVLEKALSILESDAPEAEVIVVDGGSTDGALELVQTRFPWVRLLQVEIASRDVLLTMNSDLFPTRPALQMLLERLEAAPEVGAVGPVLLNLDGSRQWGFGTLYWPNWRKIRRPTRTNLIHGACLMTRRDVLERVGGFDENFFFYNEEFDWCWRVGATGFRLEVLPSEVVHVEGASSGRTPEIQIEQNRGSLYLISKHFPAVIVEPTRSFFHLLGWLGSFLDPRPAFRPSWAAVESLAKRKAYLETPFPLSGRGEFRFVPRASSNAAPVRPVQTDESRVSSQGELVPIGASTD
jgi:N-acetylglucosaminyl-diphospho-decaprenol L-rhamnosyltransferase